MQSAISSRQKFLTDLERGKHGEQDVFDILRQGHNVTDVVDVSNFKKYQDIEIDALVHYTNRPPVSVEIKTDFYDRTGNVVFEVYSSFKHQTAGGFVKTQSDFILYYFPNSGALYAIKTIPFKLYVLANKNNLRYVKMGDDAMGFTIPIKKLENFEWFKRIR